MHRCGCILIHMHLILPLLASLLFVCGLIVIKRAGAAGVSSVTTLFCTNVAAAVAFSFLWFLGGEAIRWDLWWQPLIIAKLFVFGLGFTFLAIERGDVLLDYLRQLVDLHRRVIEQAL